MAGLQAPAAGIGDEARELVESLHGEFRRYRRCVERCEAEAKTVGFRELADKRDAVRCEQLVSAIRNLPLLDHLRPIVPLHADRAAEVIVLELG